MPKRKRPDRVRVYLLNIKHKHGTNRYVCASFKRAKKELLKYVKEWWPEGRKFPATADDAISAYFNDIIEGEESAEIEPAEVLR